METINLDNVDIPFKIVKKKNKNTYFHFKKSGYIQINLSKHQSKNSAIKYMKQNAEKFTKKYSEKCRTNDIDSSKYLYLGKTYDIVVTDIQDIVIDKDNLIIHTPTNNQNDITFFTFEKRNMLIILNDLKKKYSNNNFINIDAITLKTRYTTTRQGSCNFKKQNININLNLIKYGYKYIEYVFLHEITHLIHPNHSSNFYNLFIKLCPNYKELKNELKEIYR
jgi:predicted metal-dependent hydrolase